MCSKRANNMYVTWLKKKKKIGFRPFQQDQEMTSHKQLQHSVAQDFPKQIEEGGKILLQTHLGSQQLSVCVDPGLFIRLPTGSQTRSTPLFHSVPQRRCTPRLCAESFALLPLRRRLHLHTSFKRNNIICRRHNHSGTGFK